MVYNTILCQLWTGTLWPVLCGSCGRAHCELFCVAAVDGHIVNCSMCQLSTGTLWTVLCVSCGRAHCELFSVWQLWTGTLWSVLSCSCGRAHCELDREQGVVWRRGESWGVPEGAILELLEQVLNYFYPMWNTSTIHRGKHIMTFVCSRFAGLASCNTNR